MPTVKNYTQQVEVAPLQGGRRTSVLSPEAAGLGGGTALVTAGMQMYQDELLRQDQVSVLEADRKLSDWENKALWDPTNGAMAKRGKDAFGLPDVVNTDFDTAVAEIGKGLSTERQKIAYERMVSTRRKDIGSTISRHVFGEVRKFDDTETENYIANSRQAAALNNQDPERVQIEIERQRAAIGDYARRNGLGAEYTKQKTDQAVSDTHIGVIDRYLANGQDRQAKSYFDTIKASIAGNDVAKVEGKLNTAIVEGEGQRVSDEIWTKLGPKSDISPINLDTMIADARGRYANDPKVFKAVSDSLKERANVFNAAQRERRESNGSTVWASIEKGTTLAAIRSMPEYLALPGHEQNQIKEHVTDRAYALSQRGKGGETDLSTFYELLTLASSNATQDAFAKTNLLAYRSKLSASDFKQLAGVQAAIRKGDDKEANKLVASERVQTQIVNDAILGMGLDPTPNEKTSTYKREQILGFRRVVRETVRGYEERSGKNADDATVQSIVDNLVVKGVVPGTGVGGFFQTERRAFDLKDGESLVIKAADVPKPERAKIEDALRRSGRAVTDQAVSALYSERVLRMRGRATVAPGQSSSGQVR